MNTWKVIFATVVIFGAGVVTGGLLVKYSVQTPPRQPHGQTNRAVQPISAGGIRIEFLRRVERDLSLTPDQREQIDKIITASQERSKKLMEPIQPRIREELHNAFPITTKSENPIAAAQRIGLINPRAARGIPIAL